MLIICSLLLGARDSIGEFLFNEGDIDIQIRRKENGIRVSVHVGNYVAFGAKGVPCNTTFRNFVANVLLRALKQAPKAYHRALLAQLRAVQNDLQL